MKRRSSVYLWKIVSADISRPRNLTLLQYGAEKRHMYAQEQTRCFYRDQATY